MNFQFTPADGLNNKTTYPTTPANEDAARQQFMDLFNQIRDEMNSGATSAIGLHSLSRQAIVNGNFDVWQRGTSFSLPASFTADRWKVFSSADGGTLPARIDHSRQSVTPGEIDGSNFYYRINTDGAGSGFGSNALYLLNQFIENGVRILCGSGKKITVSFLARCTLAGKRIGVYASQHYGSGGSPSATEDLVGGTVTLTNTFQRYTVAIPTNTLSGKTFGTNNDDSLRVRLAIMWGNAANILASLSTASSETFGAAVNIDIAQVQVNAGEQAFPFQPKSFAEEMALCRRYYQLRSTNTVNQYDLSPSMRVNPTITGSVSPYGYDAEL